jgi:membrane protein implicated in regulation of membrane protease activity
MTWPDFYLICFLLGFGLSALAFLAGSAHLHLPDLHIHHGIHVPHGAQGSQLSWFNFGTLAAFLAWFGGTGYLLERYGHMWFVAALGVALLSGLAAGSVVFWFLARVLIAREAALDPADYDMVGVLGKISIPIRAGGTGEIIYSQGGTRHVTGARAEQNVAIPKGAEVIVTRYEKGIAYVRPWQDPAEELNRS